MTTFSRDNIFQTELFQKTILEPYKNDYLNSTSFSRFMGAADMPILTKSQKAKDGDVIHYKLRQTFEPQVALGNDQLEGREGEITLTSDTLFIGRFRFATKLTDEQMLALQYDGNFPAEVRSDLLTQADVLNTKRIISQFALSFPIGVESILNYNYSYSELRDRMLLANLDQANGGGISRSRIVFGNGYVTSQATIAAALVVGEMPVNNHKLTVKHIRTLAIKARTGKSGTISNAAYQTEESCIRPFKIKTHMGFEDKRYVLFIAPEAYEQLVQDPEWVAQVQRGVIETESQPSVMYGSAYKGTIEGVMVIEVPEFSNLVITNAAGNTYAYSALVGSGAIGYAMGQTPTFMMNSYTDYGINWGLAHNEISGMKVLKYPSKSRGARGNNFNLTENGLIHSFTTLA